MLIQAKRWVSNKKIRIPLICLILLSSLGIGSVVFWRQTMYHFEEVVPDKLYRSGTLSHLGLEIAHRLYGIKTIVNLRSEGEMRQDWYKREREFTRANGMNLVDIPMITDTPPTAEQIEKFFNLFDDPSMLPVLVHCEMGVIRTGMMVAAYEIGVQGESNGNVLNELPMFGHTFKRRPQVKEFIETYGK